MLHNWSSKPCLLTIHTVIAVEFSQHAENRGILRCSVVQPFEPLTPSWKQELPDFEPEQDPEDVDKKAMIDGNDKEEENDDDDDDDDMPPPLEDMSDTIKSVHDHVYLVSMHATNLMAYVLFTDLSNDLMSLRIR